MKYNVLVKPNSSQAKIIQDGKNLTVYLREKPHDGEANAALIKALSKHFNVPKTAVKILRGSKSRQKIIEI